MRLEHYDEKKLKKEILSILAKRLDLKKYKVFFFGSRIKGNAAERSDIDVGIDGDKPIAAGAWLEIQEEVENLPTLYKVEMVDFSSVSEKFRRVAKQQIEIIG